MAVATKTVSVRLPEPLLQEASHLCPQAKVSEMVLEAFAAWVDKLRRQHEDDLIRRALTALPDERKKQERKLVQMAGRSSRTILEKSNG